MLKMYEEVMEKDRILAELVILLVSFLEVPKEMIVPEANLINDLGADSLGLSELITSVEDRFDVDIPCEVAEKIKTVGDLVSAVASEIGQPEKKEEIQRPVQSNRASNESETMRRQFVSVPG